MLPTRAMVRNRGLRSLGRVRRTMRPLEVARWRLHRRHTVSGKGGRRTVPIPLGTRFGTRTITGAPEVVQRLEGTYVYYAVTCDCGRVDRIRGTCLRHGRSQSCPTCSSLAREAARRALA